MERSEIFKTWEVIDSVHNNLSPEIKKEIHDLQQYYLWGQNTVNMFYADFDDERAPHLTALLESIGETEARIYTWW